MKKTYTAYSLLPHNTFGISVQTAHFAEYSTVDELKQLLSYYKEHHPDLPILHIGSGSNLLFVSDFKGVVLHSLIDDIEVVQEDDVEVTVCAGAGCKWDSFVAYCVERGWYGAENLSAIPGEVGASAVQNIGAYGAEAKDLIVEVETLDICSREVRRFTNSECEYSYRESVFKTRFKRQFVVTHVTYRLQKQPHYKLNYENVTALLKGCDVTLQKVREAICTVRNQKLPNPDVVGNAGSFFMNPVVSAACCEQLLETYPQMPHYQAGDDRFKLSAAWLIERCGWKGKIVGHAGVYKNHALVLVNCGGATGEEVLDLAKGIQDSVAKQFGVVLKMEVNII